MPLYEYRCKECDHLEEVLQKVGAPAPVTCPACGKEHSMEKEVSLTSFQLKGGGWYKDLYSSTPDKGGKAGASDKSSDKSEKKSEKSEKSDSKKSETKKSDKKSSTSKASKAA